MLMRDEPGEIRPVKQTERKLTGLIRFLISFWITGRGASWTEAEEKFSASVAVSAGVSETLDAVVLVSSDYPPMESEAKFMFTIR
ncbi:hypothetical protein GBF38_007745 [Nibea albiflora]|uniref:Uncharacterized protein n=1 Tax=Nibea albiflora TaxID=240163 RepID=A0ACB7ENJ0_NIBAL|nr:hypothetical protein GBF38_007745 [Nibea albiflora]